MSKYSRQGTLLASGVVDAAHTLDAVKASGVRLDGERGHLRKFVDDSDNMAALENHVSRAQALIKSGELFGAKAVEIVEGAAEGLERAHFLQAVDVAAERKDETELRAAIDNARGRRISLFDMDNAQAELQRLAGEAEVHRAEDPTMDNSLARIIPKPLDGSSKPSPPKKSGKGAPAMAPAPTAGPPPSIDEKITDVRTAAGLEEEQTGSMAELLKGLNLTNVDVKGLEAALAVCAEAPKVPESQLDSKCWSAAAKQARSLQALKKHIEFKFETVYDRQTKEKRKKGERRLAEILDEVERFKTGAKAPKGTPLAAEHEIYATGKVLLGKIEPLHKVRQRAAELKPGADCSMSKSTHAALEAYTSESGPADESLAAALSEAISAGVDAALLKDATTVLTQAKELCTLTKACDYFAVGSYPPVNRLKDRGALGEALVAAVTAGVPKSDPRWLHALTYRVMADRLAELTSEVEEGRTDMADLVPTPVNTKYAKARDAEPHAKVDVGLPTEAVIQYPGIGKTDTVFKLLARFGNSRFKYGANVMLDMEAVLQAIRVLEQIRAAKEQTGTADAAAVEGTVRKAKEMLTSGALYGPRAKAMVDEAAAALDVEPAAAPVDGYSA